jgi:hypothetical protein
MSTTIHEVLDIEPHDVIIETADTNIVPAAGENTEDVDFDNARSNVYLILDQFKAAINTSMRVAAESENPRAIEVLSMLLKNAADVNKQLITMSKDKADVKTARGTKSTQPVNQFGTVQQAMFVGNSSELNKMLADKAEAKE